MTILTIQEAAAFLKVTKRTLYRHPEIPRVKVGAQLRFIREDLEQWVRSQTEEHLKTEGVTRVPKILDNEDSTVHHRSPVFAMGASR